MDLNKVTTSAFRRKYFLLSDAARLRDASMTGVEEVKSQNFAASPIITISVGKEKAVYRIHKAVLIKESSFFEKMFASGMIESQTHQVSLPEDQPEAFEQFVSWVYAGNDSQMKDAEPTMIMTCWALADKFGVPSWHNWLINKLIDHWDFHGFSFDHVSWVSANANHESALCRLVIDQFVWHLEENPNTYFKNETSPEVSQLLSRPDFPHAIFAFSVFSPRFGGRFIRPGLDPCKYHAHKGGAVCPVSLLKFPWSQALWG
ncbi:hypothetical protein AYL99_07627 [Fonsecaea erecta]|uniref:BTB domain-containing protein n=1 Tax=Fonsecaea erecta TaxID=1367422 RepID=A0A178ZFI1_9EURO|nr:hypothetical protein AYL99_07627 [Fonsecaea erecta]OAP58537.1 hypothetical protein AYL99_07627 [Fonsecaea erecta]